MTKNEKLAALDSLFECAYQISGEFNDDLTAATIFTAVGGAVAATLMRVRGDDNAEVLRVLTKALQFIQDGGSQVAQQVMSEVVAQGVDPIDPSKKLTH